MIYSTSYRSEGVFGMATQKVLCPCEEEFEVSYEVDQELTAELTTSILEGNFQSFKCPFCHTSVKTEIETHFQFQGKKIFYFPHVERNHYLSGKISLPADLYRVCFGYQELAEKVKIWNNGLSDEVIEILKYLYLEKTGPNEKLHLQFHQKNEKVEFYVQGLKENEVGLTGVPFSFYEKIAQMLDKPTEDWVEIIKPPYVSLEKVILEALA